MTDAEDSPGAASPVAFKDMCSCLSGGARGRVGFHGERQDVSAPGWRRLLELVEEAADDGREEFRPLTDLPPQERRQIVTLPAGIGKLTAVKHLMLYGSNLVRIPPEIGAMTSLEEFTPYTSYRLHWFPYEITRCQNLTRSTVSTRALFGNFKFRPPFPQLQPPPGTAMGLEADSLDPRRWGTTAVASCSVCDGPVEPGRLQQRWISLRVATDVLPLLVSACSPACVAALPAGAPDCFPTAHTGGRAGRVDETESAED